MLTEYRPFVLEVSIDDPRERPSVGEGHWSSRCFIRVFRMVTLVLLIMD
ncbi:hypothetical protein MM221_13330 [Salipaludibacillus sp. LMS25]|nr:hypothetical protein [Salipaludibacillus sp. LMS25]UTR13601.1 hypothetical protein MM221_13330 [Salipaludibacillus sp. LMS25]